MNTLQQYKCPCCGGAIEFDSTVQKMKCPYCDTEFEMETLLEYDSQLNQQQEDSLNWEKASGEAFQESDGIRSYVCRQCGGQILGDETTAATSCPYCDHPVVMMEQFAGELKPDCVIPFQLDKKAAVAALKRHCSGKKLLPKMFQDENHLQQIRGIYVPVWLFDAKADGDVRYRATTVRTWSDSAYIYTKTNFYSVTRGGSIEFAQIPVDGSSKMEDTLMESIEPYDFSKAVDFQTAYLAGYLADKYDVQAVDCTARANERVKQSTQEAFARTVHGYATVVPEFSSVRLQKGQTRYALYPVWLLNTVWQGKTYTFAMNGQTGKMAGDLPMDKSLYRKWLFGIMGAVTAAVFALGYLLWLL